MTDLISMKTKAELFYKKKYWKEHEYMKVLVEIA